MTSRFFFGSLLVTCWAINTEVLADPLVCFVVRTYWGHGDAYGGELRSLLSSLQDQSVPDWEAILVTLDKRAFPEAYDLVNELNETSRVWMYSEWIGEEYTPKQPDGQWSEGYHATLYNLTDDAIRLCSPSAEWIVGTNGDNLYGRSFVENIINASQEDPRADLVAFDFYSRYQRPTMPPCDRFSSQRSKSPPCKRNTLQWCQTDLGSVAIRKRKLFDTGKAFGQVKDDSGSLDAAHNDGLLFADMVKEGWNVTKAQDECLFAHNPSFQTCAWKGHVWDDSNITGSGGGECISKTEANRRLELDHMLEAVYVHVSHQENYQKEFRDAKHSLDAPVKCIRRKDYKSPHIWGHACWWFPDGCVDDDDKDEHSSGLDLYYQSYDTTDREDEIDQHEEL
jgi:hypothetical protein